MTKTLHLLRKKKLKTEDLNWNPNVRREKISIHRKLLWRMLTIAGLDDR